MGFEFRFGKPIDNRNRVYFGLLLADAELGSFIPVFLCYIRDPNPEPYSHSLKNEVS